MPDFLVVLPTEIGEHFILVLLHSANVVLALIDILAESGEVVAKVLHKRFSVCAVGRLYARPICSLLDF